MLRAIAYFVAQLCCQIVAICQARTLNIYTSIVVEKRANKSIMCRLCGKIAEVHFEIDTTVRRAISIIRVFVSSFDFVYLNTLKICFLLDFS